MVSGGGQEVARFQAVLGFDSSGFNSGVGQAQATWSRFGQSMLAGVGIGAGFAAVTTAVRGLSQGIQSSIGNVMSYETAFTGIRKTVDGTAEDFAALDKNIRAMATTLPVGRNELANIGQAAGQLGVRGVENITKFTETIAKISRATNLTSEAAATGFARFANVMGTPIDKIDVLASGVVALGNNMATTESEILDFGSRISGAGKIAGLTEGQVFSLGAALASIGVEAEAGGTAAAQALLTFNETVAKGGDELKLLAMVSGMTSAEFVKAWKEDAYGAFIAFERGLGKSGDSASVVLDELGLGGIRTGRALLGLAQNTDLLTKALDKYNEGAPGAAALTEEFGKFSETTANQITVFKNNIVELADTIGGPLVEMINKALPHLQAFTQALTGGDAGASGGGKSGALGRWLKWQAEGAGNVLKDFGGDLKGVAGGIAGGVGWLGGIGNEATGLPPLNLKSASDWFAPPGGWDGQPAGVSGVAKFGGTPAAELYADSVSAVEKATSAAKGGSDQFGDSIKKLLGSMDDGTKKMSDAERAEKALAKAREDAAAHVEDVMTSRIVEAYITGGDAQVAVVRSQNDALLAEFNAMMPKFKELGLEIPATAIDMFMSIKNGIVTEMNSARQSLFGPVGSESDDMLRSWAGSGAKVYRHPNGSQGAFKPGTEPPGFQLLFDPRSGFGSGGGILGPSGGGFAGPVVPGLNADSPGFGMALGGIVMPRSGGTLARLAEAGRPEAVIPLDRAGKMGGEVHFHFHGAVGDQRAVKQWVQQAYEDLKSEGAI